MLSSSSARDRVDVLDLWRQRMLVPGPAGVLGAEDLTGAGDAVDLIGIAMMERHGHHRAVGLDAVVEARPRLAQIRAAVQRAVLAAGGRAETGVEHARVLGRDA